MKAFALVVVTVLASVASAQPVGWPAEFVVTAPAGSAFSADIAVAWDGVEMFTGSAGGGSVYVGDGYAFFDDGSTGAGTWIFDGFAGGFPPASFDAFGDAPPEWVGDPSFQVPEPASLSLLVAGLLTMCSRFARR